MKTVIIFIGISGQGKRQFVEKKLKLPVYKFEDFTHKQELKEAPNTICIVSDLKYPKSFDQLCERW